MHQVVVVAGYFANEALARALKHALQQPRPAVTCERLGVCDEHGMPSAHAQCAVCGLVLHALLAARNFGCKSAGTRLVQLAEVLALAVAAVLVCASRVYLGYHTALQVAAGAAIGGAFAAAWFALLGALRRTYGWAAATPWGRLLHLKDTWPVADAWELEAAACAGLTAAKRE